MKGRSFFWLGSVVLAGALLGSRPASASDVRCGQILDQPGQYDVTHNLACAGISPAITIAANNVVLNLNGQTLSGGGGGVGILVNSGVSGATINGGDGGTVTGFHIGIQGTGCYNCQIYRNVIRGNGTGLVLQGCHDNSLNLNAITGNAGIGTIEGGVVLIQATHNQITFTGMSGNRGGGVTLISSSNNNVANNYVSDNGPGPSGIGVNLLHGSNNNQITANAIFRNEEGVLIQFPASGNAVTGNWTVTGNPPVGNLQWDLFDANPCGTNAWSGNTFLTRNSACLD